MTDGMVIRGHETSPGSWYVWELYVEEGCLSDEDGRLGAAFWFRPSLVEEGAVLGRSVTEMQHDIWSEPVDTVEELRTRLSGTSSWQTLEATVGLLKALLADWDRDDD